MFGEAWSPMSVPDLAPDDDDVSRSINQIRSKSQSLLRELTHFFWIKYIKYYYIKASYF